MSETCSYYERHIISHGIQHGEHAVEELRKDGKADEEKRKQRGTEVDQVQEPVKWIRDDITSHCFNGENSRWDHGQYTRTRKSLVKIITLRTPTRGPLVYIFLARIICIMCSGLC